MPQKYAESHRRAADKWDRENLDRSSVAMPKGKLERIKAAADASGQSVNKWINAAIDAALNAQPDADREK